MYACPAAQSNGPLLPTSHPYTLPHSALLLQIVYIMADDLNADWKNDRLAYMPNLKKYFREEGTEFTNHVAAVPVCGPSRFVLAASSHERVLWPLPWHSSVVVALHPQSFPGLGPGMV